LFKGVTLYNIKIPNAKINKIFIKIQDKKLVLKLNILPLGKSNKIELYNILSLWKFLNYIKTLQITTPEMKLNYNNNHFTFSSDDIYAFGSINLPNILINSFEYKDTFVSYINLNLDQYYNKITLNGSFYYKINRINIKSELNSSNIIKTTLNANHFILNDFNLNLKNAKTLLNIDLNKNSITSNNFIKKADIIYNNIPITLLDSKITANNKKIDIFIKKSFIKQYQNIKNITANNLSIKLNTTNLPNNMDINGKNINFFYDDNLINLNNVFVKVINKNIILTRMKKASIKNNKFKYILNHLILNKSNDWISYEANSSRFSTNKIDVNSSSIKGDKLIAVNKIIKGIFDRFKVKIANNEFNIYKKIFSSEDININNVKIKNLKVDLNKKTATFSSNSYLDENITDILKKELNISIPIIQLNGKNDINGTIDFNKSINFNINMLSENSTFKLFKFPLEIKKTKINVTPFFTSAKFDKAHLKISKNVYLTFSGKQIITYKPAILTLKGIIHNFSIYPVLNIKDFNETVRMDLKKLELSLQNFHTYVNLKKGTIIINNLKSIIPFTILKDFIKNGLVLISFENNIKSTIYIQPKLSILYKHNNSPIKNLNILKLNHITLNVNLNKNKIILYNKYINSYFSDKTIFLDLNNIDINLFPLEQFYYRFNKESNKTTESNQSTENKNILITLKNANILYKTHKFLSQEANLKEINNSISLFSKYKNSSLRGYTKHNYFLLEGKNFSNEEIKALLPSINFFEQINLDFTLVKSPDNYYIGNIYINNGIIKQLKSLNNVIAFLNTIPSLLSLSSPGFSAKGYKIKDGNIQYLLYNKIVYIKKAYIKGQNIDFNTKGYIDLNKNKINLKVKATLKLKLKKIPIIGKGLSYLLLGKDGNIDVKIVVKGDLNNPSVEKDLGNAFLPNPFTLFKRVITLPFHLF